jgi:hypothetical protein
MYIQNDTGSGSGDLFNDIFRSNVIQFVNDKQTHPIVKYKVFIVGVLLVLCGLIILLLFNHERILSHPLVANLFIPVSELRTVSASKKLNDDDRIYGYDYIDYSSDAAIFREAIEGMTAASQDTGSGSGSGSMSIADRENIEKSKKTPCNTDCTNYVELKGKINNLSKYVNAVKEQTEQVKQTSAKIQELGQQIEDLNKSLSPGGQVNIKVE